MKKRRILVISFSLLILFNIPVFSQETSQLNVLSGGLFRTEIDGAFDPVTSLSGPVFGELDGSYFFSGLTNFPEFSASLNSYTNTPLVLGYYSDSENPFSIMSGINVLTDSSTNTNGLTVTGTTTNTIGSLSVDWINQTQDTQSRLNAYDVMFSPYFLTAIGDLNLAVDIQLNFEENVGGAVINTWANSNSTVVTSNYFETTGGLTPEPVLDFTRTRVQSAPDYSLDISVQTPIYLPGDEKSGILISPYLYFDLNNASSSIADTVTAPADTGPGNINNVVVQNDVNDVSSVIGAGAAFASYAEGMGDHVMNRFIIEADAYLFLGLPGEYSTANINQNFSYAGSGAALVPTIVNTWTSTTTTRAGELSGSASIGASNSFYFDIGSFSVVGIKPRASLDLSLSPANAGSYHSLVQTSVVKTDSSGDGTIVDADDTIVTTTTTFRNNDDGGTFGAGITAELPSAITYRPDNGVFTVFVTANPRVGISADITSDVSTSQVVRTVTQVAGAVTSDNTATGAAGVSEFTIFPGFDFDLTAGAGFRFHLSENGSIDFTINSTALGTVFSAEAVFKLP